MVLALDTALEPAELLEMTREIEGERGRVRSFRNAPRTLDIDLLLHGTRVVDLEGLTVPHPRMTARAFVLVPLLELAPELLDPRTGRPYAEHLSKLDAAGVRWIIAGEELLNEDDA